MDLLTASTNLLFIHLNLLSSFEKVDFRFYVYEYFTYICVCAAWCPWRSEEDSKSPETRVTDGCDPLSALLGIEPRHSARAMSALYC